MTLDPTLVELAKSGGIAVVAWFGGRLQAAREETASQVKSQREHLVEAVRSVGKQAIEYHCLTMDDKGLVVRAEHLKADLRRIRRDARALAGHCCTEPDEWVAPCLDLHDAITGYPFEPVELPQTRDLGRTDVISKASEKMVEFVVGLRMPMFGKTIARMHRFWAK